METIYHILELSTQSWQDSVIVFIMIIGLTGSMISIIFSFFFFLSLFIDTIVDNFIKYKRFKKEKV